jgi:DNA-binding NarL/FixJ family response regulator
VGTEIPPGQAGGPTRLAIVDDHDLTRESLQNMLSDEPDIEIAGKRPTDGKHSRCARASGRI